ncbi:MAG TPA: tetratricopeptide repeat protein [Gemmatimonadaceae bacterium]|nr:tetratricopeptide repeat protein [Gemmatimonadaceae bacterium]
MSTPSRSHLFLLAAIAVLGTGFLVSRSGRADSETLLALSDESGEVAKRDIQIAAWKKALAADSGSAIALGQLAGLYAQRARETGDESNYLEAESYARRSVRIRTNRNGSSLVTLASSLIAQHRFAEADSVATMLVQLEPDVPEYRALLGEIKLDLGDYEAARTAMTSLHVHRNHLSIAPRLARLYELIGDNHSARQLLHAAATESRTRHDLPREQVAWFHLRAGEMDMRYGRPRSAKAAFTEGLKIAPGDPRLLIALARLEAANDAPRKAIEYAEHVIARRLDLDALAVLSDSYAGIGDTAKAHEYSRALEVAVSQQPGAHHREWSHFLLDNNRRIQEVVAAASSQLQSRRDIYAYDLLAWALYKAKRNVEAREAMTKALRTRTGDPLILYHAGAIEYSLGDAKRARKFLDSALRLNPNFHRRGAGHARRLLDVIGRQ